MIVSEFVTKYKKSKQPEKLIEGIIKTKYLSYVDKIGEAKSIIRTSSYKDVNGRQVFVLDSPVRYFLFVQSIVKNYTNLDFDKREVKGDDGNVISSLDITKDIDLLEESGVTKAICNAVGQDIETFNTVVQMVLDDETDANRSITAYLDTKFETLGLTFDTILKAFDAPEVQAKIVDFVSAKKDAN